jgi:hypothetical protein
MVEGPGSLARVTQGNAVGNDSARREGGLRETAHKSTSKTKDP